MVKRAPQNITQKKIYQRHINSGAITNIAELLCFVADKNLILTRRGASFVGVKDATGRRFRLFLPSHSKAMKAGIPSNRGLIYDFWIYALFAVNAGSVACYVGQTRNISRRIQEHWKRRSGTRASGPLFAWAERHGIEVNFVLLQSLRGCPCDANHTEAEWKIRAARSGCSFPSGELLGAAMQHRASNDPWPFDAVAHSSQPLEQLATGVITLASIDENSMLCDEGYRRVTPHPRIANGSI